MLTTSLLSLVAAVPQGPGTSTAPVVINEFSYDDTGADDRVFVELYTRTNAPVDISGWSLEGVEGTDATPSNGTVAVPANTILPAGGYYVIGQALGVPNVDLDVPSMNLILETGPDGLVLRDAALNDIDGVTWEQFGWTNALPTWLEGDGLQGDVFNNDANPQSAARKFDGHDDDDNGLDFRVMAWSPGTSNQAANTVPPAYANDFEGTLGSTTAAAFTYSSVPGTIVDPTTLGISNSPRGGNCSIWNLAGGGNANYFNAVAAQDLIVECYVWINGPSPWTWDADDAEFLAIGVRGTTDSFGEFPDLNGLHAYAGIPAENQSGATGIALCWMCRRQGSGFYLIDFNDGGPDFRILSGPISNHVGWTRVRLRVEGGDVVANFGGNFGRDDGQRMLGSNVTVASGGVYIQYHETVTLPGVHNPLLIDGLRIMPITAMSMTQIGAGSPTTLNTPWLTNNGPGGLPVVGNLGFTLRCLGLVPYGNSFTALTIGLPTLPGTQIPGAPTGALLYLGQPFYTVLRTSSSVGTTLVALGIPGEPALAGVSLGAQIFDVDTALAVPAPFGTSPGFGIVIGN